MQNQIINYGTIYVVQSGWVERVGDVLLSERLMGQKVTSVAPTTATEKRKERRSKVGCLIVSSWGESGWVVKGFFPVFKSQMIGCSLEEKKLSRAACLLIPRRSFSWNWIRIIFHENLCPLILWGQKCLNLKDTWVNSISWPGPFNPLDNVWPIESFKGFISSGVWKEN